LSTVGAALHALDLHVAALRAGSAGSSDLNRLRRVVRTVLALALDDPEFDVTVTAGSTDIAVRVHHSGPSGLVAEPVAVADEPVDVGPTGSPTAPGAAGSRVVSELAEALRRGQGRPR
jgi:hypothetical protein